MFRLKNMSMTVGICVGLIAIGGVAGRYINLPNWQTHVEQRQADTEKRVTGLEKAQAEQAQEIRMIRNDIGSLREAVQEKGRQTESQFRDLLQSFAEVRGSIATVVNQVSVQTERIAAADKRAQNAEVIADKAIDEVNALRVESARIRGKEPQ